MFQKYVGATGRKRRRIKEHQTDVNKEKSVLKITGLSQHLRESRHTLGVIEILAKENNTVKQKFKWCNCARKEGQPVEENRKEKRYK